MQTSLKIALLALLALPLAAEQASAYAESPLAKLRRTHDKINLLLKQRNQAKAGTAEYRQYERRLTDTVNAFVDFTELSRRALGRHWAQRSPRERAEFVDILRQLIERSYVKQVNANLDYQLQYKDETVAKDSATVTTVVSIDRDGRTEEVAIVYKMRKVKQDWMVYDVITDDVSILRNYRSQFNRIIQRDSYQALVDKMRRKLDKLQQS